MSTLDKIQTMLEGQFGLKREQLQPEQVLAELGIESLSMVEFMFELENEFAIDLSSSSDNRIPATVAELVTLVDEAVAQQKSASA